MLDGTDGAARLVFESGDGRRQAAKPDRWIAIIRLQPSTVRTNWSCSIALRRMSWPATCRG